MRLYFQKELLEITAKLVERLQHDFKRDSSSLLARFKLFNDDRMNNQNDHDDDSNINSSHKDLSQTILQITSSCEDEHHRPIAMKKMTKGSNKDEKVISQSYIDLTSETHSKVTSSSHSKVTSSTSNKMNNSDVTGDKIISMKSHNTHTQDSPVATMNGIKLKGTAKLKGKGHLNYNYPSHIYFDSMKWLYEDEDMY